MKSSPLQWRNSEVELVKSQSRGNEEGGRLWGSSEINGGRS